MITRSDNAPDTGTEGDRWVDTYDSSKVYLVKSTYDLSAEASTLTISSSIRPGSVDLVFTSLIFGNLAKNISVEFVDQGANGTSSLEKTGSGTRSEPYIYTFKTFQDNNSNDRIIELLVGDLVLTASGADASVGSVADTSGELTNSLEDNLYAWRILFDYYAAAQGLISLDDYLPTYIPRNIQVLLPEAVAARLAIMHDGMRNASRATAWQMMFNKAVMDARESRWKNLFPTGMRR